MRQQVGCIYNLLTIILFIVVPSIPHQVQASSGSPHPNRIASQKAAASSNTLRGSVWHDLNHNGQYDEGSPEKSPTSAWVPNGEPAIPSVDILLWRVRGSENGTGGSNAEEVLEPIATASTTITGTFVFTELLPGDYYIDFGEEGIAVGHQITDLAASQTPTDENDFLISTADPQTRRSPRLTLRGNDDLAYAGMGIWFPVSVGNRVWYDIDGNGIQDPDEEGVPNIGVILYSIDRNGVLSYAEESALTDEGGFYRFGALKPAIYLVGFDLASLPPDYVLTRPNSGQDDELDSDIAEASAYSATTAFLESGSSDTSLDLGLTATVQIGDWVWEDADGDGFQDDNERGVAGVSIHLHEENGALVDTTVSDANGQYLFSRILPGVYYISATAPENFEFSAIGNGDYVSEDNDIDPNSGESAILTLTATANANNIDIGLTPAITPTPDPPTGPNGRPEELITLYLPLIK